MLSPIRFVRVRALLVVCTAWGCGGSTSAAKPADTSASVKVAAPSSPAKATATQQWATVANPDAHYIVALGIPTTLDYSVRTEHLDRARAYAARTLQSLSDLELAPAQVDRQTLATESARRHIAGLFLECGVLLHDVDERGTHFSVNLTVVDLRTANILGSLSGRATAPGPTSSENERRALEAAIGTALSGVPELLASLGEPSTNPVR